MYLETDNHLSAEYPSFVLSDLHFLCLLKRQSGTPAFVPAVAPQKQSMPLLVTGMVTTTSYAPSVPHSMSHTTYGMPTIAVPRDPSGT